MLNWKTTTQQPRENLDSVPHCLYKKSGHSEVGRSSNMGPGKARRRPCKSTQRGGGSDSEQRKVWKLFHLTEMLQTEFELVGPAAD